MRTQIFRDYGLSRHMKRQMSAGNIIFCHMNTCASRAPDQVISVRQRHGLLRAVFTLQFQLKYHEETP
ncbi:MAG: hypothetical protein WCS62_01875 [Bacilli bacterium]